jgi:glycosyltransferase involved in cell wall biosynthesis
MDSFDHAALGQLTSVSLDPLFWRPARLGVDSAWYGHVPFAHWIVAATRPQLLVELGSHAGVSYSAFCDAVLRERTGTQCFAVDVWTGDEHAGFYGEEIFQDFKVFHDRRYAGFSQMLRMTFDDAREYIPDGGIDLLHIDGRHHYEDVRHDFTSWEKKLSPRAVVLFHDTNVRERDFGVWRLWDELTRDHPHFEFFHAHGLGVLMHGPEVHAAALALCRDADADRVRERFSLLGERWEEDALRQKRESRIAELEAGLAKSAADVEATYQSAVESIAREREFAKKQSEGWEEEKARLFQRTAELQYDAENLHNDLNHALAQMSYAQGQLLHAQAEFAHSEAHRFWLEGQLAFEQGQNAMLLHERHVILSSTMWRLVSLLKRVMRLVPGPARHALKNVLRRLRGQPPIVAPQVAPAETAPASGGAPLPAALPPAVAETSQAQPKPNQKPKPTATPKPVAPARESTGKQRIVFISGEPDTPGHDYRVLRATYAGVILGWKAEAMTIDVATNTRLEGADIVVIWRATWSEEINRIFGYCQKNGIRTIFDVDDLMFRPELARNKVIDGIRSQRLSELDVQRFYIRVNQTMRAADMASCTTPELASHLRLFKKPSFVVPNCWDMETWWRSRLAVRRRAHEDCDGLIRIGYASGTRTHQKDFAVVAPAIARVLRDNPSARLVLFRDPNGGEGIVVADEFEELHAVAEQIEWRDKVALPDLPAELARFDINLAPLEVGNPFVEAKSELKYWEAALAGVPTVASPTGPYKRAIEHGRTGYLAGNDEEWAEHLAALVKDPGLRARIAHHAYLDTLWRFGPLHHQAAIGSMLDQAQGGRAAARAMLLDLLTARTEHRVPHLPDRKVVFERDQFGRADVTVIVPVYNYAHYVREALDSAAAQTAAAIDLVVVDDCSRDASLDVVMEWAAAHAGRFNRIVVAKHVQNAGLGFSRNTGFDLAETPYVLPLDADNTLRPDAALHLAERLNTTGAAFAYPTIQRFGKDNLLIGDEPFLAARLISGNFIDAMALVRRDAWAAAGGYDHVRFGWEDYDFWCRLVELGLWGEHVQEVLADYRAHEQSMLHTQTDLKSNKIALINDMKKRHDWLDLRAMVI